MPKLEETNVMLSRLRELIWAAEALVGTVASKDTSLPYSAHQQVERLNNATLPAWEAVRAFEPKPRKARKERK